MSAVKLIISVLLIGSVYGQHLLGAERCTWGPAYWCKDVSAAKECNAVSHCMTTSWKNDATPIVELDDCCTKCEAVIERLHNYATLSERDVVVILNTVCDVVPNARLRQSCKDGVQKYVKEVMDMVIAKINSTKICTLIRLCKTAKNPQLQTQTRQQTPTFARVTLHKDDTPLKARLQSTETCELCKLSVMEARSYIGNADNQKKIIQFVKQQGCGRCPDKDKCLAAVDNYAPIVFTFLQQELNGDTVCGLLGLCGKAQHPLTPALTQLIEAIMRPDVSVENGDVCQYCTSTLTKIRAFLADAKRRAQIKDFLKNKMCLLCPSKNACQNDIDKYADQAFNDMDQFLSNPQFICQQLGLCSKQQVKQRNVNVEVKTMDKSKKLYGVQCTICEFAMREIDNLLKMNRTEKAIIEALDKVCSILPSTVKDECVSFVNQYGNMVIQLLIKELAPSQVCTALGLCDGQTINKKPDGPLLFSPYLMRGAPIQAPRPALKAKASPQCIICEFVMSKLDQILAKNATEQDIIRGLDKVCSLLPSSVGTECRKLVDEYGPAIIKILAQDMRPTIVCTVLGLCPFSKEAVLPAGGEFCEVCETAMMYVDSLMKENSTQEDIEHLLLKVCNFLPQSIRGECNMLVMLYTPEIVQLLVNELPPKKVCTMIRLCTADVKTKQEISNMIPLVKMQPAQLKKAKNLLGVDTKKCMYGPSYWCASRFNAKKCKMTAHCQEHYWSKGKPAN